MSRLIGAGLLLVAVMSLAAQQLTVGTVALGPGQTGTVNVKLAANSAQVAGLQFDVTYDPTVLTSVTINTGGSTTTAAKMIATNTGPAAGALPPLAANTQRTVIIGNDATQQTLTASGEGTISDGTVATLVVTVAAGASTGTTTPLTVSNAAGTTPAAGAISFGTTNGVVEVNKTYYVGDTYPANGNTIGNFGVQNGSVSLNSVFLLLLTYTSAQGYPLPPACSDLFDAMDTYPVDTATTRGGDGQISLNDVFAALLYQTSAQGYTPVPKRAARGGVCLQNQSAQPAIRTARTTETYGSLLFGAPEPVAGGQERVPVYMQATRAMSRVGLAFSAGDQQSTLQFVAGDVAPALNVGGQKGLVAVAWGGLDRPAGARTMLGYILGPAGFSANLRVFGASGTRLNDDQEVSFEVSGATTVRQ